jgi:hypothetical protein
MHSIRGYFLAALILLVSGIASAQEEYAISVNGQTYDLVKKGAVDKDAVWKFDPLATFRRKNQPGWPWGRLARDAENCKIGRKRN